jgi:two-component system response regulator AdeR
MSETPTVLVVEDEEDVADTYARVLSSEYTVRTAYTGAAGLEALDEEVDVVLLDRRMPEMSGDEVLVAIRERDIDPRVVMVTAVDPDVDVIAMEFDEYLVKPVQADQLYDVVERMLARKEQDERIQEMFAVASKLATLEGKMGYEDLQNSEEYAHLREEFERMREELDVPETDDSYLDATVEKMEALLRETR